MRSTIDHVDWAKIAAVNEERPDREYISRLWAEDWDSPEDSAEDD
jgi:hypothetical protein